jgi:hypothetical protein
MTVIKPIADRQPVFEGQTVHGKTFSKPNKTLWTLTPIPTAQKWWEKCGIGMQGRETDSLAGDCGRFDSRRTQTANP